MAAGRGRGMATSMLIAVALSGCAQRDVAQPRSVLPSPCGVYPPQYGAFPDGHGCATAIILQNIVADPADLVIPDFLPLPYGDAAIAPVQRHRGERVKLPSSAAGTSTATPAGGEAPKQ